ncbi:DUF5641 domain-containing protein [Trichonephila clavipes]|nr:DUF5641 domain-containing protein [Trichonephila clavipes]
MDGGTLRVPVPNDIRRIVSYNEEIHGIHLKENNTSDLAQDIRVSGTPDLVKFDRSKLLVRPFFCQELREQMRSRFRKEYLGQLIRRHGQKNCELKDGDIVLVGCENLKRVKLAYFLCSGAFYWQ